MKLAIGIFATAVALFVFGFVFWAASPLPYGSWNEPPDPAAAKAAVHAQFPATGVYGVPGPGQVPDDVWAMVYVRHELPDSLPDPAELLKGFVHYVLVAGTLALVLTPRRGLGQTVARAALLGVVAVVVLEGTDLVWWGYPLGWKLWGAIYHVLLFVIGGLALAWFLPRWRAPGAGDDAAGDAGSAGNYTGVGEGGRA